MKVVMPLFGFVTSLAGLLMVPLTLSVVFGFWDRTPATTVAMVALMAVYCCGKSYEAVTERSMRSRVMSLLMSLASFGGVIVLTVSLLVSAHECLHIQAPRTPRFLHIHATEILDRSAVQDQV